jgi:hypothetical protein
VSHLSYPFHVTLRCVRFFAFLGDNKALSKLYANRSYIVGVAQALLLSLLLIVSLFIAFDLNVIS